MPVPHGVRRRDDLGTDGLDDRAAGAEAAARRRVGGARQLAAERRLASAHADDRLRHRGDQRPRIGMRAAAEYIGDGPDFGDPPEIHHRDTVRRDGRRR